MAAARRPRMRTRTAVLIVGSVLATVVVVLLYVNATAGEKRVRHEIRHLYSVRDAQFMRTMGVLLGPAILGGNAFQVLRNGDEIFPAMLDSIRGAHTTIDLETYIYWSGAIGKAFADALAERARAGVRVCVMLDWFGSAKMDAAYLKEMEQRACIFVATIVRAGTTWTS